MKDPNIKTKVVHSQSKPAWNVVGTRVGQRYKIARVPYVVGIDTEQDAAREYAEFRSGCFNNSAAVVELLTNQPATGKDGER